MIELFNNATMCEAFVTSKLSLSIEKTCYTLFLAKISNSVNYFANNLKFKSVKSYKFLAAIVDKN